MIYAIRIKASFATQWNNLVLIILDTNSNLRLFQGNTLFNYCMVSLFH
jgi:hypothetical protein